MVASASRSQSSVVLQGRIRVRVRVLPHLFLLHLVVIHEKLHTHAAGEAHLLPLAIGTECGIEIVGVGIWVRRGFRSTNEGCRDEEADEIEGGHDVGRWALGVG